MSTEKALQIKRHSTAGGDEADSNSQKTMEGAINEFFHSISSLDHTSPIVSSAIQKPVREILDQFAKYLHEFGDKASFPDFLESVSRLIAKKGGDGADEKIDEGAASSSTVLTLNIPPERAEEFSLAMVQVKEITLAQTLIERSFILTLIAQFDSFLGALIRALAEKKPDILGLYSKSVSYSEILEAGSLDVLQARLVDAEVEAVLRDSHASHFDWLEKKLDMPLRANLEAWPTFIELTERRNLFAHGDASVSKQYLIVCQRHGVKLPADLRSGTILSASTDYFKNAYECVLEIGVKLGQTIWRKTSPGEFDAADRQLIRICRRLISQEHLPVLINLLDYFLHHSPGKARKEVFRLEMALMLAEAYKRHGNETKCKSMIGKIDLSATSSRYRFLASVVDGDIDRATEELEVAVKAGDLTEVDIKSDPLCRGFREDDRFPEIFATIFGHEYEQKMQNGLELRQVDVDEEALPPKKPSLEKEGEK